MTQAINAAGFPVLRGVQLTKEVAYLNMREAAAAAALDKLWSDTFLTNAGIDAANSSRYTYRGAANYDVIRDGINYTKFLAHFNVSYTPSDDVSARIGTIVGGNVTWQTNQKKFGAGSIRNTGGSNSYLSFPDSSDFTLGTNSFCFEGFFRFSSLSGYQALFEMSVSGSNYLRFGYEAGSWKLHTTDTGVVISAADAGMVIDTWYHIAFVRNGTSFKVYRDGVEKGSGSHAGSISDYTSGLKLLGTDLNSSWDFNGYADEIRISIGTPVYTAAFTPPSDEFDNGVAGNAVIQSVRALDLAAAVTTVIPFVDVTENAGSLVSVQISTNDGLSWTTVTPDIINTVPSGQQIKIRVTLSGDAELESWGIAA